MGVVSSIHMIVLHRHHQQLQQPHVTISGLLLTGSAWL